MLVEDLELLQRDGVFREIDTGVETGVRNPAERDAERTVADVMVPRVSLVGAFTVAPTAVCVSTSVGALHRAAERNASRTDVAANWWATPGASDHSIR